MPWVTTAILGLALGSCRCSGSEPTPAPDDGFDETACQSFVVGQGFGLAWGRLNHRVSTWSVGLDDKPCRPRHLRVTHIGGDFSTGEIGSDQASVSYAYQLVDADRREVGASRVSVDATVGPEHRASGTLHLTRAELGLRNYSAVVAVVDGLHFETGIDQVPEYPSSYDAAHGYTMRGFGANVEVVGITDDAVDVKWELHFEPGPSKDRSRMNDALEVARVGAKLDILLLGTSQANVHTGSAAYSLEYPQPQPLVDQEIAHATDEQQRVELQGNARGPEGFAGLAGFDFQMHFRPTCQTQQDCPIRETCQDDGTCTMTEGEPGEYLRAISVGVSPKSYDRKTGKAEFALDGYVSNASRFIAFYALRHDFEGKVVWVQVDGAGGRQTVDETFETGAASFALPQDSDGS